MARITESFAWLSSCTGHADDDNDVPSMTRRLRSAAGETFRSFAHRNFRLFFLGQMVSQAGTWMQSVAIVWLVLQLTGDGLALGLVTAAEFLPVLVLGAWAGVVADRADHHRLMTLTQVAFLGLSVVLSAVTLTGAATVPLLLVLSLVFGTINAFDNPTRRALVVELVPRHDVPNAVGLNSALMTGARVVGPAIAGAVIAGPGPGAAFVLNSVTYLAVIVALLRLDRSAIRPAPRVARAKGQLRAGLRYAWRTPEVRVPLVMLAVVGMLAFNHQVTLPLLAERTFRGTATTYTLLLATMSAGSVAGALTVARRSDVTPAALVRSVAGVAVASAALAVAPTLPLALVAALALGFTSIGLVSGANAVVQLRAAPAMRGRVLALLSVVFLGSTPIGGPIVGWVAEVTNPRAAVALGGAGALAVLAWALRQLRAHPELGTSAPAGRTAPAGEAPPAGAPAATAVAGVGGGRPPTAERAPAAA
ncbi:MAG: MFS transporter [Acidimicrobiia bacterium]